ncbi:hypothetical protein SAMD00019534_103960, partial [Acytostelium subglobosum LB1]|uniref:hypothetical protein n=1 Tax=Acytostelium subglobosum LB1 TaxID=1410327 RepID=UPI00064515B8
KDGIALIGTDQHNIVDYENCMTADALRFVAELHRRFDNERLNLLNQRIKRQAAFVENGYNLAPPDDTTHIREDKTWRVAQIPQVLQDRSADIVCLNVTSLEDLEACMMSGATGVQVDFDDGFQCGWSNVNKGLKNINTVIGKHLHNKDIALLLMRPRSLNLSEYHMLVDGEPVAGALFDFGIHMYHNGRVLLDAGRGPFFYIPKLEGRYEALWWNRVLSFSEQHLGISHGATKVIVLIENIQAAFEMPEMLYYLKDYAVALNTGRWDYIFSVVKAFSGSSDHVFPERSQLGLDQDFLQGYYRLLVNTCHELGALATGGMSPQFPLSGGMSTSLTDIEKEQVFKGKSFEAGMGFDGALVAHPSAVQSCKDAFKSIVMPSSTSPSTYYKMILTCPKGEITDKDVRASIEVFFKYIHSWFALEQGALPLNGIVEDLATAEINRALLWKWIRFHTKTKEGHTISFKLVVDTIKELMDQGHMMNPVDKVDLFRIISVLLYSHSFVDFMTTVMYPFVTTISFDSPK